MKHLSLFLISLVWSLATFADDVTIPLTTSQQESEANLFVNLGN